MKPKLSSSALLAHVSNQAVADHSDATKAEQQKIARKKALRSARRKKIEAIEKEMGQLKDKAQALEADRPSWIHTTLIPSLAVLAGPLAPTAIATAVPVAHGYRMGARAIELSETEGEAEPSAGLIAGEIFLPPGGPVTDGARQGVIEAELEGRIETITKRDLVTRQAEIKRETAEIAATRESMQDDLDDMKDAAQRQTRAFSAVESLDEKRQALERRIGRRIAG